MKKIISLAVACVCAGAAYAVTSAALDGPLAAAVEEARPKSPLKVINTFRVLNGMTSRAEVYEVLDETSNCRYFMGHDGSLTPRLDASGKPRCGKL